MGLGVRWCWKHVWWHWIYKYAMCYTIHVQELLCKSWQECWQPDTHTYTYTFPRSYILTYSLLGWLTRVHGAAETEEKLKSPAPPSTNYTPPRPHRGRVWGKRAVREARINDTELDINAIVKTVQLTRGSQSFAFWLRFQKISFWLYALNHLSRHSALEDKIFVYLT